MDEEEEPPEKEEAAPQEEEPEAKPASLRDVPLTIAVELTRFTMSLDRLIHLAPGNSIDLPLDPTQKVSLSHNGKVIGKGELIAVGEKLGIRITSLGL